MCYVLVTEEEWCCFDVYVSIFFLSPWFFFWNSISKMPIITDPDNENQTDKVILINETPKPRVRSGCTSILVLLDLLVNFSAPSFGSKSVRSSRTIFSSWIYSLYICTPLEKQNQTFPEVWTFRQEIAKSKFFEYSIKHFQDFTNCYFISTLGSTMHCKL